MKAHLRPVNAAGAQAQGLEQAVELLDGPAADQSERAVELAVGLRQSLGKSRRRHHVAGPFGKVEQGAIDVEKKRHGRMVKGRVPDVRPRRSQNRRAHSAAPRAAKPKLPFNRDGGEILLLSTIAGGPQILQLALACLEMKLSRNLFRGTPASPF